MSNDSESTFLDVEDDDQRQKRIGTLLERLDTANSPSPKPLPNINHERLPGPVEPSSELLARVQAFLPAISASNEALSKQNPKDINIEHVSGNEERYIEMVTRFSPSRGYMMIIGHHSHAHPQNLGLGVLEAKPRSGPGSRSSPRSEADSDVTSSEMESDSDSSDSSSEEDSESDYTSSSSSDDSDESDSESSGSSIDLKPVASRPIKPLPRRVSLKANLEV